MYDDILEPNWRDKARRQTETIKAKIEKKASECGHKFNIDTRITLKLVQDCHMLIDVVNLNQSKAEANIEMQRCRKAINELIDEYIMKHCKDEGLFDPVENPLILYASN